MSGSLDSPSATMHIALLAHCTCVSINLITTTFNCLQKDSLSQNTVIKNS